jgi:signal transduction histidine kinase
MRDTPGTLRGRTESASHSGTPAMRRVWLAGLPAGPCRHRGRPAWLRSYPDGVTLAPGRWAGTAGRQRFLDTLLAGALLALVEFTVFAKLPTGPAWIIAAAGAAATIPLARRRRAPLAVLVITGSVTLAAMIYRGSPGLLAAGPLAALYTVATISPRRISLSAGVLTLAGATAGLAAGHRGALTWESFALPWAVITAAWLIGDNLRVRRAYVAELEAKAARADADRAAEAARATARERARIARELHDMVVHHVSVIAVQTGAARLLAGRGASPADTQQALADVEATARQALGELRQLLGILRHDGGPLTRTATPGLDQLDRLLGDVRRAGLPVEARTEGEPVALPAAVDISAYRIVQEALTNVLKHQGCVPASIIIRYSAADLRIEITDDGPGAAAPAVAGAGHGLAGMRERVAMFGGELDAGPRPGGGFTVAARIPLGGTPG